MVDLRFATPIIRPPCIWAVAKNFHVINDLNAKEIVLWHVFRV